MDLEEAEDTDDFLTMGGNGETGTSGGHGGNAINDSLPK